MSGNVLTYDPSSVIITVCGYQIPGIVSVSLIWQSEIFSTRKGIRGAHTRIYNQDRRATLVLEVLPTSVANDVFSEILLQDAAHKSGRLEVAVKDASGTSRFQSNEAYIHTFPEVVFTAEGLTTRKWEIEILSFVSGSGNLGGNTSNGIDINDILSNALDSASAGIDKLAGFF
jgi:hypothetical protein